MSTTRETLDRLDSRHDELIRKLDDLNAQIEQALAEFAKPRSQAAESMPVPDAPATVERRRAA